MNEVMTVAKQASLELEQFLKSIPETIAVINVENDRKYMTPDIDMLWVRSKNGLVTKVTTVEIKGDRYYRTGNYFFETISNGTKNTLGCFMYTSADYIFYYFVDQKELHILPMPETRDWFNLNIDKFKTISTSTSIDGGGYNTVGKLVPRELAISELKNIKVVKIQDYIKE